MPLTFLTCCLLHYLQSVESEGMLVVTLATPHSVAELFRGFSGTGI